MSLQDALRDLYRTGEGWREFFEMLSTYTNRRSVLNAENAANHTKLAHETIVEFLRHLARLEIGKFKFGRRGAKTRIIWNFSPRSVGDVAQGKAAVLERYVEGDDDEAPAIESPLALPAKTSIVDFPAIIEEAKSALAARLGISPDQVNINLDFSRK
jgi:hypothetical protein